MGRGAVTRAQGMVAAAAASVLVLGALALVATRDDGGSPTEVLGHQVVRTTTSTSAPAADATTTLVEIPTSLAPVPIDQATTTTTPGAAAVVATTTTRAPTAPSDPPQGRSVEQADTTASFDYRADGGGVMTTTDKGPPRDPFVFKTLGSDTDHDGACELRAEMANQTSRDITFPDGLVLRFILSKDGQQWRTVELRFPDTQSLPAGGSLEVESATPLGQQYGHYDVGGEVTVQYS